MHPIILLSKSKVKEINVRWCHLKAAHCGRGIALNEIRDRSFWFINTSSLTKSVVFNCVTCRQLREKLGVQIMTDLPKERFEETAPFTYCVADMFQPFKVKVKQSEVKRYGAMFTCLASRHRHLYSNSKKTDPKKRKREANTFRQCTKLCWSSVRVNQCIQWDGPHKDLRVSSEQQCRLGQMEEELTRSKPHRWYMGAPNSFSKKNTSIIVANTWSKFGWRISANINGRNWSSYQFTTTLETINEKQGFKPLWPNILLTTKSKVVMPPPGIF